MLPKPTTVYLISGSNRGIGLSLVRELASNHPDSVVFAGTREPSSAVELQAIALQHPNRIFIVKLVSADSENNKSVAREIEERFGRVDIVISNAGISNYMGPTINTPASQMRDHYEINVIGTLSLFQSFYRLLEASPNPKFIPVSAAAASSAYASLPAGYTCYAASKAAMNLLARRVHFENPWLVCFPFSPGVVTTDMAILNRENDKTGSLAPLQDAIAISPEECARRTIEIIQGATREEYGGEFVHIDGTKLPW